MPAVTNKTKKPLSISLPGGKTLHLGPGKTGQIAAKAAQTASLKKLVEAGEIEIAGEDSHYGAGVSGGRRGRGSENPQSSTGSTHRSGNR
jgi:hypothetical protein